jgi:hypothetical protein
MQRRRLRELLIFGVPSGEAFERRYRLAGDRFDRRDAEADLNATGEHRTAAALRQAAAEAWATQLQIALVNT